MGPYMYLWKKAVKSFESISVENTLLPQIPFQIGLPKKETGDKEWGRNFLASLSFTVI